MRAPEQLKDPTYRCIQTWRLRRPASAAIELQVRERTDGRYECYRSVISHRLQQLKVDHVSDHAAAMEWVSREMEVVHIDRRGETVRAHLHEMRPQAQLIAAAG